MPALAKRIEISEEDRAELERIVRSSTAEVRMLERAQIVLAASEGHSAAKVARRLGCSVNTAQKWRSRYERDGISGLRDLPRSGKPLTYSQSDRARLIAKACTRPPETPEGRLFLDQLVRMSDIDYSQWWLGAVFRGRAAAAPRVMNSSEAMEKAVAANPDAIGFLLMTPSAAEPSLVVLTIDRKPPADMEYPVRER